MITRSLLAAAAILAAVTLSAGARPVAPYMCGDVYVEITTNKDAKPWRTKVEFPFLPHARTVDLPRFVYDGVNASLGGKRCRYLDEEATTRAWKRFGYEPPDLFEPSEPSAAPNAPLKPSA